jgi:hypothetical protein
MHLLLGHPDDLCCAGVQSRLAARGLDVRVLLSPLEPPARLTWRLDADGVTSSLFPGIPDSEIAGVLVRDTGWLDPEGWELADHAYMQAEVRAVMLAWLAGLACPVINRPIAAHWYGMGAPVLAWRRLLRRSGLPLSRLVVTSDPAEARTFREELASDGIAGAVYAPLTGAAGYLLADDDAWDRLARLQAQGAPACLTEPHGPVTLACVIGAQVVWDATPDPRAARLEPALIRFAASAGLTMVEMGLAPAHAGPAVVVVEPRPQLERFSPGARHRILDALAAQLAPAFASEALAVTA